MLPPVAAFPHPWDRWISNGRCGFPQLVQTLAARPLLPHARRLSLLLSSRRILALLLPRVLVAPVLHQRFLRIHDLDPLVSPSPNGIQFAVLLNIGADLILFRQWQMVVTITADLIVFSQW
uniref:Uncharacterized protein n=1 Tax=Oryza rufipogon TaxID=4529 RepID=A0A0E0R680_ORYRU